MGCGPAPAVAPSRDPVDLSVDWTLTAPESVGMDEPLLTAALGATSSIDGLESVAVVRRGRLVAERYLGTASAEAPHPIRSVTKSVIALLVGQAIERGVFSDPGEALAATFHPPLPVLAGEQATLTLDELLTMTSGFQWDEGGSGAGYNAWVLAPDQIEYLLARPFSAPPGTEWNYNSAAVHLLSAAITSASGMGTDLFADETLLGPLGIRVRTWEVDNRGIPNGGAGLSLRTRDLAKVGTLVLQGGRSGTTQVVPRAWLDAAIRPWRVTPAGFRFTGVLDYGRLWWLGRMAGNDLQLAWGHGGQFVAIFPGLDLVVVTTARWQGIGGAAADQEAAILGWVAESILPAVH